MGGRHGLDSWSSQADVAPIHFPVGALQVRNRHSLVMVCAWKSSDSLESVCCSSVGSKRRHVLAHICNTAEGQILQELRWGHGDGLVHRHQGNLSMEISCKLVDLEMPQ